MRSPTFAQLWEIWYPRRWIVGSIIGMTAFSWLVHASQNVAGVGAGSGGLTLLDAVLVTTSFVLACGVFGYSDSGNGKSLGGFPRRLFTLPVSSFRLVVVPMLAGVCAIELLFLLWGHRLFGGGLTRILFVGVLLASFMVFLQAVLWSLERLGAIRLAILAVLGLALVIASILPYTDTVFGPASRYSEAGVSAVIAIVAATVFLVSWWNVARLRSGGGQGRHRFRSLIERARAFLPRRSRGFASSTSAQFWFDWRVSGLVLPALVAGVVVFCFVPFAWFSRDDSQRTFALLQAALAMPVALAVPVGLAFSKPTPWSEDLSFPAFLGVRPLSVVEIVETRLRVAALASLASWLVVLTFLGAWFAGRSALDIPIGVAPQWSATTSHPAASAFGTSVLVVLSGMFLTWRFLVAGLWLGLSGRRSLFQGWAVLLVVAGVAVLALEPNKLAASMIRDPARLNPFVWAGGLCLLAKMGLAARTWRGLPFQLVRRYLVFSLAGTACLITLVVVVWNTMKLPPETDGLRTLLIVLALMLVPVGRLGLAPLMLAKNRHRS